MSRPRNSYTATIEVVHHGGRDKMDPPSFNPAHVVKVWAKRRTASASVIDTVDLWRSFANSKGADSVDKTIRHKLEGSGRHKDMIVLCGEREKAGDGAMASVSASISLFILHCYCVYLSCYLFPCREW